MGTAVKISSAFLPAGTNLLVRLPENAFADNGETCMSLAKSISLALLMSLPLSLAAAEESDIFGHEEEIRLFPGDIRTSARLDTGASMNSLYGVDAEVIEKSNGEYVRFNFVDHNDKKHAFTRPLIEKTTVTQASGKQERYVVEMRLCVGDFYRETAFTLADRSRMSVSVLVGRNFMEKGVLVDSDKSNTVTPQCQSEKTDAVSNHS